MRLIIAGLLALSALSAPAVAAAQPESVVRPTSERMAPFAWLIGNWRGAGWIILPDGTRHNVDSQETVTPRLSGNALLIEGRHNEAGQPDRIVHDAIALITWDSRANAYRFRSALATGMGGDFPITPTANGFTWGMTTPAGQIEYVVTYENGVWTERGRRTGPDGRTVDFFEMTLRRQ
jgi:hypothetical protein